MKTTKKKRYVLLRVPVADDAPPAIAQHQAAFEQAFVGAIRDAVLRGEEESGIRIFNPFGITATYKEHFGAFREE